MDRYIIQATIKRSRSNVTAAAREHTGPRRRSEPDGGLRVITTGRTSAHWGKAVADAPNEVRKTTEPLHEVDS